MRDMEPVSSLLPSDAPSGLATGAAGAAAAGSSNNSSTNPSPSISRRGSSSNSNLHLPQQQQQQHRDRPHPHEIAGGSTASLASSLRSRASSTSSVQAVPFRTPARPAPALAPPVSANGGGGAAPGMTRSANASSTGSAYLASYFAPRPPRGAATASPAAANGGGSLKRATSTASGHAVSATSTTPGTPGTPGTPPAHSGLSTPGYGYHASGETSASASSAALTAPYPARGPSNSTLLQSQPPYHLSGLTATNSPAPSSSQSSSHSGGMTAERPPNASQGSSTLSDKPPVEQVAPQDGTPARTVVNRKTINDFEFVDALGEGSYSTVSLVRDKNNPSRQYALKVLDKAHIKREKKTKYVLIERDTLKTLDGHPGIVRLFWTFQDLNNLYFVLEYACNGELLHWIKRYGSFALPVARFYMAQIVSAVEHMHAHNIIHRDLKPENILLDERMCVKITDFGTAKELGKDAANTDEDGPPELRARPRSFVGTPEYVSPEILSESRESSKASDCWALGCILYQLIAGRPPFAAATEYLMFRAIEALNYGFPDDFPPDAADLVRRLLVLDPAERPDIDEIKRHGFFDGVTDFSPSLWAVDPPPLETGITPPRKRGANGMLNKLLMTGGSDDEHSARPSLLTASSSLLESSESALDRLQLEMAQRAERNERGLAIATAEAVAARAREAEQQSRREGSEGSAPDTPTADEVPRATRSDSPWSSILRAGESVVHASAVLDRNSLISRKRTLVLTDHRRLLIVKEGSGSTSSSPVRALGGGGGGGSIRRRSTSSSQAASAWVTLKSTLEIAPNCTVEQSASNARAFTLKTRGKSFKFEDQTGAATRWVDELRQSIRKRQNDLE